MKHGFTIGGGKHKPLVAACAFVILAVTGCQKKEEKFTSFEGARMAAENQQQQQKNAELASRSQIKFGDVSTPIDKYTDTTKGNGAELAFAWYATQKELGAGSKEIASIISPEYGLLKDEFKKKDIVESLMPKIKEGIETAKQNRYYKLRLSDSLIDIGSYDEKTKSFPLVSSVFSDPDAKMFLTGAGNNWTAQNYTVNFVNSANLKSLLVPEEKQAREIEAIRAKGGQQGVGSIWLYFCVGDPIPNTTGLYAELLRIRVLDKAGNLLAERTR
jgi:hypothetical protein